MATFLEAVTDAAKAALCFTTTASSNANSFFNSLTPDPFLDVPNLSAGVNAIICDDAQPVTPVPPYEGGQCNALYTVTWSYRLQPGNVIATPSRDNIQGPLGAITGRSESCFTQFGPGFTTFSFATDANGQQIPAFGNGICQVGLDSITYLGATVSRSDGQPDDCGNPPPDPYPEEGTDYSQPVTYINNEGDQITEQGDFTIFAPVLIGGAVFAPVSLSLGGVEFNGTIQISPEFKFELFPNGLFGGGSGTSDPPPPNIPDGSEPGEEEPDRRAIVGAIVRTTSIGSPKAGQISQGANPDIWIPRIANISFLIRTEKADAWTNDIAVKNTNCYVPCPVSTGAIDVKGTAEFGFQVSITPVYAVFPSTN